MESSGKSEGGLFRPFLRLGRTQPAEPVAAPTSTVGTLLCAARMRLGKDLQRIAEVLHIRYNYLVAIEDGRYEDLPGQAYAIGFVRAYADHLGLDGDEVVRRYKEESAGVTRQAIFEFSLATPDSGVPSGALILIAMVCGMLVYGVWYSIAGSDRSAIQVIQQVPDRLMSLVNSDKTDKAATASIPDAAPGGDTTAAIQATEDVTPAPPDGDVEPGKNTEVAAAPEAPADVVELRAKLDTWVTLRDPQKTDHTQFLRKGEVFKVEDARSTTLLTAKASDLEVLINGKVASLGDDSVFAKGVVLDPDHLKAAPASPSPAAPAPAATPATTLAAKPAQSPPPAAK
jgi:cytoskeleton protein RodZ